MEMGLIQNEAFNLESKSISHNVVPISSTECIFLGELLALGHRVFVCEMSEVPDGSTLTEYHKGFCLDFWFLKCFFGFGKQ